MKPIYRRIVLFLFLIVLIPFSFSYTISETFSINNGFDDVFLSTDNTKLSELCPNNVLNYSLVSSSCAYSNYYLPPISNFACYYSGANRYDNVVLKDDYPYLIADYSYDQPSITCQSGLFWKYKKGFGVNELSYIEFDFKESAGTMNTFYSRAIVLYYDNFTHNTVLEFINKSNNELIPYANSDWYKVRINFSDYFDLTNISYTYFDSIGIIGHYTVLYSLGVSGGINIDNVTLGNIDENNLPLFNISINNNNQFCLNASETNKEIPISWEVYDLEGDGLYYGYSVGINNYTTFETYYNYKCIIGGLICDFFPSENTPKKFLKNDNLCNISVMDYNYNNHNQIKGKDLTQDETIFIQINGNCNNLDKSLYYIFPFEFNVFSLDMDILDFDINESFNISLLSMDFNNKLFNLNFRRNETDKLIYMFNNNVLIGTFNNRDVFNNGTVRGFKIFISNTQNNTQLYIKITNSVNGISLDNYNYYYIDNRNIYNENINYKYFGIVSNPNTFILNSYLSYSLVFFTPEFSSTPLNSIIIPFSNYQKHYFFYISDSEHYLLNQYNKKDIWISGISCNIAPNSLFLDVNNTKMSFGNLMYFGGALFTDFCSSTNDILNFLGTNINTCNTIYIVYVMICIFISLGLALLITMALANPNLSFGIAGIVFSLSQFFTRLFFHYSNSFAIAWGLIFAVSVISLIIGLFANSGSA